MITVNSLTLVNEQYPGYTVFVTWQDIGDKYGWVIDIDLHNKNPKQPVYPVHGHRRRSFSSLDLVIKFLVEYCDKAGQVVIDGTNWHTETFRLQDDTILPKAKFHIVFNTVDNSIKPKQG